MFATERYQKIRQILLEYKRAEVSKLSIILNVSEVTIRKDLERLEKEGFLIRTHGGAVINENGVTSEPAGESLNDATLARLSAIGAMAEKLIEPNDLLFLGVGRTCTEAARHIKEVGGLTVVTNNISSAMELSENKNISIITTGGNFVRQKGGYSLMSPGVVSFLSSRYFDKAIISVDGVSISHGLSVQDETLSQLYGLLFERARQKIILVSGEKFERRAFFKFADITQADAVVTDENIPEEYLEYLCKNKVKAFCAYDIKKI